MYFDVLIFMILYSFRISTTAILSFIFEKDLLQTHLENMRQDHGLFTVYLAIFTVYPDTHNLASNLFKKR